MANSPFGNIFFRKKKSGTINTELQDEDKVVLPEIFGVKPWLYLAFLYGAAALAVLFFILIYPGLSNPGVRGVFDSEPRGAAVRIDDVTLGYTPCTIFIPRGKRSVEFVLPGFNPDKQELDIKGRIFASLLFPSRVEVSGKLDTPDPAGALAIAALEYMRWAAAGEPTEAYQIPMVLSEGVYRTAPAAVDGRVRGAMQNILDNSLPHAVTGASARDLLRAQFLLDSGGLSPTSLSMLLTLRRAVSAAGNNGASAAWLSSLLSDTAAHKLAAYRWFTQNTQVNEVSVLQSTEAAASLPGSLTLEGLVFTALAPGSREKYGRRETMPPMMAATHLVSQAAWDMFTKENPEWNAENRDNLVERGLVGEDYLKPVDNSSYPQDAAPGVSWYAAEAYCAWLSAKLPPALADWEVRLPSEAEWEYAAGLAELDTGLLWEWGGGLFAPLDFFPAPKEPVPFPKNSTAFAAPVPDRTVRGGSWINPPGSAGIDSRGALPPSTSSPFVGLRPVIVSKREN